MINFISFLLIGTTPLWAKTYNVNLSVDGHNVAFKEKVLKIPANEAFKIQFKNMASGNSGVQHNVVIIKAKDEAGILKRARENRGRWQEYLGTIGNDKSVLAFSPLLWPNTEAIVSVPALKKGKYVYICLVPGHGDILKMRGDLIAQ